MAEHEDVPQTGEQAAEDAPVAVDEAPVEEEEAQQDPDQEQDQEQEETLLTSHDDGQEGDALLDEPQENGQENGQEKEKQQEQEAEGAKEGQEDKMQKEEASQQQQKSTTGGEPRTTGSVIVGGKGFAFCVATFRFCSIALSMRALKLVCLLPLVESARRICLRQLWYCLRLRVLVHQLLPSDVELLSLFVTSHQDAMRT
jgi:hypothetical protein